MPALRVRRFGVLAVAALMVVGLLPAAASPVRAVSPNVVISQVYGGGGNTGATYTHDFVELFNRGSSPVSLAGWSVQYTSAAGTGLFSGSVTQLSGTLAAGQYVLIRMAAGSGGTTPLPTPDVTGTAAMGATAGKVIVASTTTGLACNGGSTPCSAAQLTQIVDLVGYGTTANFYEGGGPAPAPSNTTAVLRSANGCADTDNNAADFTAGTPTPRNTASPLHPCAPVINEFSASTAGTDVEYVEIFGAPSTDYSAHTLLEIEGDAGTAVGTIDEVIALGTTGANNLYLVSLPANALENGTITLLLVKDFTGALNVDLDTNNDGVLDATPWSAIVDAVAVNDGGAGDVTYGVPALGVAYDGAAFAPGGASRIPDGFDTNAATDWVRNDFDLAGIPGLVGTPVFGEAYNTPGAANQAVPQGPVLAISDVSGAEGNAGTTTFDFTVSVSVPAEAGGVTFDIATADNTATVADNDYVAKSLTGQTIPAGSSSYTFGVTVNGDTTFEANETFFVNVANVTGATVTDAQGQGTIQNDDVAITRIHAIQGSGAAVTGAGPFTIEAIVVGDYQTQGSGQLRGFFVQEEDADVDADPATSEGIFVFCSACPVPVSVGDRVRVTGTASEFFNMSQLSASTAGSVTVVSSGNPLPTPASVELPVPGVPNGNLAAATAVIDAYFEAFEGMFVRFPDTLSVSEYFEVARYGQVILTEGGRPHTFTAVRAPSAAGFIDHEIDLARRTVILDDTDNRQNRPVDVPNTAYYHPVPGLSTGNYFRGGDTITNLTGVLHWSFAGQTGTDAWRIRPVTEAYSYTFTPVNTRSAVPPSVGGSLKVASFNVLNYFPTIDTTSSNNVGTCGPSGTLDCRGADSAQELARQRTKLLAALSAIDADVFGFMEMENTPGVEPLADIVAGLPGYAYIDTGVIGTDAIRVGIIYKSSTVAPVGGYAILDSTVDPRFDTSRNRPALAQTFSENATGARFTVVVNHLKSKGSGCGAGDDDTTTGQGNCNGTRTLAAQALADWLATDPTGSGDADVLIIGDLNSYAKEDPIVALEDAGYTNVVADFGGESAYGYVFDGQLGYLDHALANASLTPQVTGVAEWHINADEIPLFDYNDDVRDAGEAAFEEESDVLPLYEPNTYRTSDHDPVIVGLNLVIPTTTALTVDPSTQQYSDTVTLTAMISPSDATGSVQFAQSSDAGATWTDLGGPIAVADGAAVLADVQVLEAAGTDVRFRASFEGTGVYTDSEDEAALIVTKEDASVLYGAGNPVAAQVDAPGSGSWAGPLVLTVGVRERTPDLAGTGSPLPGDIANAGLSVALVPLGPGGPIDLACVAGSVTGTGYDAVKPFTCASPGAISLGTYEVVVSVTGDYYAGSYADAFTVYDPSLGFATGGGTFALDGDRVTFGFTTKYNKKGTTIQGQLIAVRHHADGTGSRLKSNALSGMAILDAGGCGIATFAGKATYTTWDPAADGGLGAYVTTGNNTFSVRADDCNNPGTGIDKIRVVGPGVFAMASLAELTGGNIAVPHTIGQK